MLLLLDNYDSFTYNLAQYLGELGQEVKVVRNDKITVEEIAAARPERIVISPGPCTPNEAGVSLAVIEHLGGKIPILGVCLGHQAIGQAYGGKVVRAPKVMHGKTSPIAHDGRALFNGLPNPMQATRYHSLVVEPSSLPSCLRVDARVEVDPALGTGEGEIMALSHTSLPVWGVQFHPESILTVDGKRLLQNFLELA
jgi:anthranilate synthase/aminodeoxychorismate synthase-like glutamine amidotransferase